MSPLRASVAFLELGRLFWNSPFEKAPGNGGFCVGDALRLGSRGGAWQQNGNVRGWALRSYSLNGAKQGSNQGRRTPGLGRIGWGPGGKPNAGTTTPEEMYVVRDENGDMTSVAKAGYGDDADRALVPRRDQP